MRALESVREPVAREVAATKRVWPSIAAGLPAAPAHLRVRIEAASASAAALSVPAPFGEEQARALTGPATAIAGTYRTFAKLARSAWTLIAADARAIQAGPSSAASFARANEGLYVESIYDAHYALAQIGKKIRKAFHDLGGAKEFASTLTQARVDAMDAFYSEANARLTPRALTKFGS